MLLRDAGPTDGEALGHALMQAVNWDGQSHVPYERVLAERQLSHYVTGWPRPGDFGTVAVDGGAIAVGAAWCRVFDSTDPGYGYVADGVPELSVGLRPGYRGRGIGTALIDAVISQAVAHGHTAISLSVADDNRAAALYTRFGFGFVSRSGGSSTLLLTL